MDDRIYYIKISPEVIKGDIFKVGYLVPEITEQKIAFCCDIVTKEVTKYVDNYTYVYSSMTDIVSGGTWNKKTHQYNSLLTGLTVPIMLTENTVDIGYYSVFDGMILQKETMINFLFSANTQQPYFYYFYNTSDTEFKKYLEFSNYYLDWGDNSPIQTITTSSPNYYSHTYPPTTGVTYTISMSGMSPWGSNVIKKDVTPPYIDLPIKNPNGTAYFKPAGGNWSNTLLSYDYIFSGDENCDIYVNSSNNYTTVPFLITGYTKSSVNDLQVYGPASKLVDGKFKLGVSVTGTSGNVGIYSGASTGGLYTGYSINNIDYYDYIDGTTLFAVYSSGLTPDMLICSATTKNEVLLNVIDEAQIESDVYIERGKISALERLERLGEVDNLGDLIKYGYGFFNISDI
jgi:hypothetical protein